MMEAQPKLEKKKKSRERMAADKSVIKEGQCEMLGPHTQVAF